MKALGLIFSASLGGGGRRKKKKEGEREGRGGRRKGEKRRKGKRETEREGMRSDRRTQVSCEARLQATPRVLPRPQLPTSVAPLGSSLLLLLALSLLLLGPLPLQLFHYFEVLPLLFLLFLWRRISGGRGPWHSAESSRSLGQPGLQEAARAAPLDGDPERAWRGIRWSGGREGSALFAPGASQPLLTLLLPFSPFNPLAVFTLEEREGD